ncbi:hypothetical protein AXF42_Ash021725 [Apostasia shenzhenica]|uniref:Uncharacterized protein n=1 Tax=Apostasia shenzhenica TaxID=1088818 RepID=A0A2H9ZSN4_9ASPA|nr:hypothetical protein AXF42_Ash021725 [Apostasia shenzhenica]
MHLSHFVVLFLVFSIATTTMATLSLPSYYVSLRVLLAENLLNYIAHIGFEAYNHLRHTNVGPNIPQLSFGGMINVGSLVIKYMSGLSKRRYCVIFTGYHRGSQRWAVVRIFFTFPDNTPEHLMSFWNLDENSITFDGFEYL